MRKTEDIPDAGAMARPSIDRETLEKFLHRIAIGGESLRLRDEDRKKARELVGLLPEIGRVLAGRASPLVVDAAAGSGWVGIAMRALVVPDARLVAIEHDAAKAERARLLAVAAGVGPIDVRTADVADASAWPEAPELAVALHACGAASDVVIERAAAAGARTILVAPCCVASTLPLAQIAATRADQIGLPRPGPVRRRFVESFVLGARLLTLESLGYATEAVPFVGETVTPYNVVLRGRRGRDGTRIARAKADLEHLLGGVGEPGPKRKA